MENSENSSSDSQELPVVKNGRGRPRRAPWRSEGDKYNDKAISETYCEDYCNEHIRNVYVKCPYCEHSILKPTLPRHIRQGKACLKFREHNLKNIEK